MQAFSHKRCVCNKPVAQLIRSNKSTQERVLIKIGNLRPFTHINKMQKCNTGRK